MLARQQASVIIESILQTHFKRAALVTNYQSVIAAFKSSQDSGGANSSKRSIDEKYKVLGDKVAQPG